MKEHKDISEQIAELSPIAILGAIVIVGCHVLVVLVTLRVGNNDFLRWFYTGATSVRLCGDPYVFSDPQQNLLAYPYPPLTAYLLLPFAWMPRLLAGYAWAVINLIMTAILAEQISMMSFS